jgi:hypothetical protein
MDWSGFFSASPDIPEVCVTPEDATAEDAPGEAGCSAIFGGDFSFMTKGTGSPAGKAWSFFLL